MNPLIIPASLLNFHNITFVQPSYRYPDDEEIKNEMCKPLNAPQLPWEWFELNGTSNINGEKIGNALGIRWLRRSRLSPLHHLPLLEFVKVMMFVARKKGQINENLQLFGEQQEMYGNFEE